MIKKEIRKAAGVVSSGGTILYPTDTIWGIGCDATDADAVQKVYKIKQRSDSKSMLVLMSGTKMLEQYLRVIPPDALEFAAKASKPTTIIYPDAINLAENLLAEDGSVGIRITTDEFCRDLIDRLGVPIVSTSANRSGKPSPGTFSHIDQAILSEVDHVVKWRQDEKVPAIPSTIVKVEGHGEITILRP